MGFGVRGSRQTSVDEDSVGFVSVEGTPSLVSESNRGEDAAVVAEKWS